MRPFLFPAESSSEEENPLSGRLSCPNRSCNMHIGKFSWPGLRCSCGKWVVPALALVKGRVDIIDRSAAADTGGGTMGIRLPPGMIRNVNKNRDGGGGGNL